MYNFRLCKLDVVYSGSQLSEVQEPHPQPPPRKRGGDYDVPHVISKRYSLPSLQANGISVFHLPFSVRVSIAGTTNLLAEKY
ncbi:hypothetical protein [Nostoc sp.]|uniref:hypothetical protein n=1 Tax=Nostoc sp. TaxID=1180 RepID=UPI002FF804EE